jgi:hypothetical protein
MSRRTRSTPHELTPEQQAEAQRLREKILAAASADIDALANLLAGTTDATIFGDTEFLVRDIVHGIGAKAVETALQERKKGGTKVRA